MTWHSLQQRGFEDYVEVLGRLGALGLRPPLVPPHGPNDTARIRA